MKVDQSIRPAVLITLGLLAVGTDLCAQTVEGLIDFRGRSAREAVVELLPADVAEAPQPAFGENLAADTLMIDQRHLRFAPTVLAVAPGTVVEFKNSDPILHNVFSPPRLGADFDLGTYPQDESRARRFNQPGNYVILCHVHPEMAAWVIVGRSPYVAVADDAGLFAIQSVPPGAYTVRVWFRRREFDAGTLSVAPDATTTTLDVSLGAPR